MFDVTELKEAEARVAHMAYHDGLTSLANRQLFEETLTLAVERAKRDDTAVAVVFLDLDNFKLVNDSLGHHAGDELLIELAQRLRMCTRETDLVARQGGDEFLMLLADLDHRAIEASAVRVAERVVEALTEPFELQGADFQAQGSIGISLYPRDALDAGTLLKNADIAMYRTKRLEPGGHTFFSIEGEDATDRLSFEQRLRRAVEQQSWVLHYQPVVDLADRRVVGAEALIRWKDFGGIVPPGEFIPIAEELGLIEAIGDWVIDQVAAQQRAWRDAGLDLEVSFNLSPRQLWTPRLADRLLAKLRDAGVDPSTVQAEITESTAMADPDRTQRTLRELHAWGLRL
ncbi:MAG: diguanylate cyclase, partial [Actinomycetota bacterium]